MADLDTIVTNLDRIIVSGKLHVGQATIVLDYVTLREMLDAILLACELGAPKVAEAKVAEAKVREHLATFTRRPPERSNET